MQQQPEAPDMPLSRSSTPDKRSRVCISMTSASNNETDNDRAEVSVEVNNPENMIEKIVRALAQKFPAESVMTIQARGGVSSTMVASRQTMGESDSSFTSSRDRPAAHTVGSFEPSDLARIVQSRNRAPRSSGVDVRARSPFKSQLPSTTLRPTLQETGRFGDSRSARHNLRRDGDGDGALNQQEITITGTRDVKDNRDRRQVTQQREGDTRQRDTRYGDMREKDNETRLVRKRDGGKSVGGNGLGGERRFVQAERGDRDGGGKYRDVHTVGEIRVRDGRPSCSVVEEAEQSFVGQPLYRDESPQERRLCHCACVHIPLCACQHVCGPYTCGGANIHHHQRLQSSPAYQTCSASERGTYDDTWNDMATQARRDVPRPRVMAPSPLIPTKEPFVVKREASANSIQSSQSNGPPEITHTGTDFKIGDGQNFLTYVEVPVYEEKIVEVPVTQYVDVPREIKETVVETREVIEEYPEVEWREVVKEVDVEEWIDKEVKIRQVIEKPVEKIVEKSVVQKIVTENILQLNELRERSHAVRCEQKVLIPRVTEVEQAMVIAETVEGLAVEGEQEIEVETFDYEPILITTEIPIPKPVPITAILGKTRLQHKTTDVSVSHWNSMVQRLNSQMPAGYQHLLPYQHNTEGSVPLLPSSETLEIIVPRQDDWRETHEEGQRHVKREAGYEESPLLKLIEDIAVSRRKEAQQTVEANMQQAEANFQRDIQSRRRAYKETYQQQRRAFEDDAKLRGVPIRFESMPQRCSTEETHSSVESRRTILSNTPPPPNQRPPLPRRPPHPPSQMCT